MHFLLLLPSLPPLPFLPLRFLTEIKEMAAKSGGVARWKQSEAGCSIKAEHNLVG